MSKAGLSRACFFLWDGRSIDLRDKKQEKRAKTEVRYERLKRDEG
ncbi:hypothetical protein A33Q_0582 [Indibacter alkaliphilus LW1]|uniref:Uncharacterized protein n=1 Tax=Indibacter alkaliphilus (strain CCUG 57479 / KCTC 22604 / LW1) TaxID=1189612 RepID=S2DQ48_INDAL|nr:hypothetical protein A33Q_0582 [Indibacter alkaliphilus LW1]